MEVGCSHICFSVDVDRSDIKSRVIGSKIQVAGWTVAGCMLWTLKLCVTFFYLRLTVRMHASFSMDRSLRTI
jgi:hypothetical protein